jgi:molybdopterin converting factor small subunit
MRVTVEFFGPAREAAGQARLGADCDMPVTAQDLVVRLARQRGGRLAHLLLANDRLAPSVLVAVNDVQAAGPVPLKDGDEITVLPPISGGSR